LNIEKKKEGEKRNGSVFQEQPPPACSGKKKGEKSDKDHSFPFSKRGEKREVK